MDKIPLPPGFQSRKIQPVELPNPASFRELRPAILGTPPGFIKTRLFERRRVFIGLGIAAAVHVTLGLAWWLTPPLRLKAGIDPKRWVQVVSLPKQAVSEAQTTIPSSQYSGPLSQKSRSPHATPSQQRSPSAEAEAHP